MLIPAPSAAPALSSLHSLSSHYFLLPAHFLPPGSARPPLRRGDLAIRNGGGPRTYPGGVSKWQWKRMQAKKARQLLKARLARERQLYEMRKRTEVRDAVAHLERPWDPDSAADASAVAPNLLSVAADDQLRALADRFHRPGGVDLWNDRDGPRVFASPATGAASARFFPKNAVHSVQPYALVGDGGEASAPRARGNAADMLLLGRGDGGAQGVRENATEDEAYCNGDDEPAVELMERDGTWEPVDALAAADDSIPGYWSSDDDDIDIVPLESKDMGDARSRRAPRATTMHMRNGRNNGVTRWEATGAMAAASDDDRGWSGDAFFSDSEQAREGHREQRWQQASNGAIGAEMEPRWGARNNLNGRENFGGRSKPKYGTNTSDRDAPGRHMRANNGDKHQSSSNGRNRLAGNFAEDLETPTWKPRRINRARNNNGDGRDDNINGRFRRGNNARRLQENPKSTNREDGPRMNRNGQRFRGEDYSLRPTSELHGSWREMGSDEL
ncbi:hypothetical protein PVAP13_1NG300519 [Panicum virgatum]|uniref:DEAD-box ATP-dependent RNA helicase 33 n=1 Tax=Panicum virgatum TaxID=38727 RepID=A0A8T0WUY1_PANVG|nr:hypothetical protein PVAP13_1NG300519 [Panicum virgatum]